MQCFHTNWDQTQIDDMPRALIFTQPNLQNTAKLTSAEPQISMYMYVATGHNYYIISRYLYGSTS